MPLPLNQSRQEDSDPNALAKSRADHIKKERERAEAERINNDILTRTRKENFNKSTISQYESDLRHIDVIHQQAVKTLNETEDKRKKREDEIKKLRDEDDHIEKDIESLRSKLK